MRSRHASFLSFCTIFGTFSVAGITGEDSFSAVTTFDELGAMYLRMRIREPHLEADETTDIEKKRLICASIARSGFFATTYRVSVNMDDIYVELESKMRKEKRLREEGRSTPNIYYETVLKDYELRKSYWRKVASYYRYPTRLTTFDVYNSKVQEEEYAFACAVRHRYTEELSIFYVSDAYNINTDLDIPADGRISARFVCLVSQEGSCDLAAIAEEPAKAFRSLEYSVEEVYLRLRRTYDVAETESDDTVCGLTRSQKLRLCASVMGSSHFASTVKFRTVYGCEKNRVSLLMENAEKEADVDHYEWMLTCSVEPTTSLWSTYYVSRAYQSHYAIVYSQDYRNYYLTHKCDYCIVSIDANVSVIIENDNDGGGQLPSSSLNLIDLLEDARLYK